VHRSVLHNDEKILSWLFDQLEARDRVAVDEQQVRERAFLHNAELAVIRAAQARQRKQFGVTRSRRLQDFGGCTSAGQLCQSGALPSRDVCIEPCIRAPRRPCLMLLGELVGIVGARSISFQLQKGTAQVAPRPSCPLRVHPTARHSGIHSIAIGDRFLPRRAPNFAFHHFLKYNLVVLMKCDPYVSSTRDGVLLSHDETQTFRRRRSSLFNASRTRNGSACGISPRPSLSEGLLPEEGSGKSLQRAVRLPDMDCLAG
jgi:hypothetical protein